MSCGHRQSLFANPGRRWRDITAPDGSTVRAKDPAPTQAQVDARADVLAAGMTCARCFSAADGRAATLALVPAAPAGQ